MTRTRLALVLSLALAALAPPAVAQDKPAEKPTDKAADKPAASPVDQLLVKMADTKFAANRLEAANAAASVQDEKVLAPLTKLLRDDDADVRLAAVKALGARTAFDHQKKSAEALGARIKVLDKKVESQAELLAVVEALRILAQPASIDALLDGVREDGDLDVVRARLFAVANVPAPEAIEKLIEHMARGRRGTGVNGTFAAALSSATGERATNDPDFWRAWWKDNKATFDFRAAAERRHAGEQKKADREAKKKGDGGGKK